MGSGHAIRSSCVSRPIQAIRNEETVRRQNPIGRVGTGGLHRLLTQRRLPMSDERRLPRMPPTWETN